ncbi:MAG TPA: hypothetical protein VG498_13355, partial [Terriglobales bacterium]|nr:hypothetical protein [Terriglobales bacterium]
MEPLLSRFGLLLGAVVTVVTLAAGVMAQSVEVVATGNADQDVLAIQNAVDHNEHVTLIGHFSFDGSQTVPTALPDLYPQATIKVRKSVSITGTGGDDDEMTTIKGGTIPFYVEAPGASVTIQSLRFESPTQDAIFVYAVNGLMITKCKFKGIVPVPFGTSGAPMPTGIAIDINTSGHVPMPMPMQAGHPENISGRLLITNNDINLEGASFAENTLGITVFAVGRSPDREADIYVSGNSIRHTTEPAINFRLLGGRANVESNVINTGNVSSRLSPRPEAIRVANTGSYVIAHNAIKCEWPDSDAIGIGVFSQFAAWQLQHVIVKDNDVIMSPPSGTVFGDLSAGIDIRGFTRDNFVANNRIQGRARAAIAVDPFRQGIPINNELVLNNLHDFEAALVDVVVGMDVTNTLLLGQEGSLQQDGSV